MKPAIVSELCISLGLCLAGSGAALAQAPAQAVVQVECKQQQIVLPARQVELAWETKNMCNDHANATKKAAEGKKLSKSDAERVKMIAWLDANLAAGDKLNIDRFGRATLIRCSSDPNAMPMPKDLPKIGDGTYELYLMMELPAGTGSCPKPS
jgi:hypothetical protein